MTDKSFGDHMSRNVVKNPLLTSAVTGLSIEDLTHNAVLLPVPQSPEVITQSDQNVSQNKPLGYAEYTTPINQSGDAKSMTSQPQPLPIQKSSNQNLKIQKRNENIHCVSRDTVSKASVKTDDDFDVNEYFARLQCTRYVSAPLSTSVKEDVSADLIEKEENLEEINLNEPEKSPAESQGITADIAQNFSQLPTVLPQVASAVFSSFSNMLSMRSREDTPERVQSEKQEAVQQDNTVPLMSMPELKQVAPPPKEPPSIGGTNYRLLTKKKYAQIPGLSTGDQKAHQNPYSQNFASFNQPPKFFVPSEPITETQAPKNEGSTFDKAKDVGEDIKNESIRTFGIEIGRSSDLNKYVAEDNVKFNMPTDSFQKAQEEPTNIVEVGREPENKASSLKEQKDAFVFYNPNAYTNIPTIRNVLQQNTQSVEHNIYFGSNINSQSVQAQNAQAFSTTPVSQNFGMPPQSGNFSQNKKDFYSTSVSQNSGITPPPIFSSSYQNTSVISNPPLQAQSSSSIIPPPPMFSNVPRRDSLSNTAKSVLPPSVARRISSNHPFFKTQAPQAASFSENIFVPTMPLDSSTPSSNAMLCSTMHTSVFAQMNPSNTAPEFVPSASAASVPLIPSLSTSQPSFSTTAIPVSTSISVPSTISTVPPVKLPPCSEKLSAPPPTPMSVQSTTELFNPSLGTNLPPPLPHSSINLMQKPATSLPPLSSMSSMTQPVIQNVASVEQPVPMIFNPLAGVPPHSESGFPPNYKSSSFVPTVNTSMTNVPQSQTEIDATHPPINYYDPNQRKDIPNPNLGMDEGSANLPTVQPLAIAKTNTEVPKPPTEPPKATGTSNFRLTKKKPQYYAGPIEGVGAISNNIIPILEPVQPSSFQGALFTPKVVAQENVNQPLKAANEPFDISKQSEIIYTPYELGKSQQESYGNSNQCNTSFDLSRPASENYEPQKQEGKGFGIIGSLKSKLGAIDINKIQNTVTTFFDPAYNEAKSDETLQQENQSYGQPENYHNNQLQNPSQGNFESNFEIFVPNVESNQYSQLYGSQNPFQYQSPNYITPRQYEVSYQYQNQVPCQQNQYYQSQEPFSFYQVEDPDVHTPAQNAYVATRNPNARVDAYNQNSSNTSNVYTQGVTTADDSQLPPTAQSLQSATFDTASTDNNTNALSDITAVDSTATPNPDNEKGEDPQQINTDLSQEKSEALREEILNMTAAFSTQYDSSRSFFDKALPHVEPESKDFQSKHAYSPSLIETKSNKPSIEVSADVAKTDIDKQIKTSLSEDSDTARELDETKALANALASFTLEDNKAQNFLFHKDVVKTKMASSLDVSSTALLGLSTMLADKSKELSELESDAQNLKSAAQEIDTIFNRGSNASFFDDLNLGKPVEEDKTELDICETCREVDKPEDKEPDPENLTDQLIENITSPIQLLNPVEVPLTESSTQIDEQSDFISKQFEEISHITEETIETIQVQSATDLLDDDIVASSVRNYGWATDTMVGPQIGHLPSADSVKDLSVNPTILPVQDFSLPNPNSIGFLGNTALCTENIPQNLSSDISPESQFTGNPLLLRQISIPSAPPTEEDTKSDETGIDVHSIEQDAKKDFPLEEDFVIEPSATDDDNEELKTEEIIPEESHEFDSFTNRVERFKKMEEEYNIDQAEPQKNTFLTDTTSPSIPIASYFDTGNYAVETHYRNSVSSPSSLGVNVNSPNNQARILPGFEQEYSSKNLRSFPETTDNIKNFGSANVSLGLGAEMKSSDANSQRGDSYKFKPEFKPTGTSDLPVRMHKSLSEITSLSGGDNLVFESGDLKQRLNEEYDLSKIPLNLSKSLERTESEFNYKEDVDRTIPLSLFSNMTIGSSDMLSTTSEPLDLLKKLETESPLFSKSEAQIPLKQETSKFDQLKIDLSYDMRHFKDSSKTQLEKQPESQLLKTEDDTSEMNRYIDTDNYLKAASFIPNIPNPVNSSSSTRVTLDKDSNVDKGKQVKETPKVILQDPINFFASTSAMESPAQPSDDNASGFSRLASYFASPTKTSDKKSFFELSQSQDHYREDSKSKGDVSSKESNDFVQVLDNTVKHFFDNNTSLKDTNSNNISISQERFNANMNLIKDLTSPQNLEINPELNLKTVNYFTVELTDQGVLNENIDEADVSKKPNESLVENINKASSSNSSKNELENVGIKEPKLLIDCEHCCDFNLGNVTKIDNVKPESVFDSITNFKVKKCMSDSPNDGQKDNLSMDMSYDRGETSKKYVTVNIGDETCQDSQDGVSSSTENRQTTEYTPVRHHWFYRVDIDDKSIWRGFSVVDSNALEKAYQSPDLNEHTTVPTDGGRYDVNVIGRLRTPVYWADKPTNVRRCSWFYKGTADPRYVPYTESVAEKLEEEYRRGVTTGEWHRRLVLPHRELVVMHGAHVMVHFLNSAHSDPYTSPPMFARGKRVYRNPPRIHVIQDEAEKIDHLLLMVHGVGEHRLNKQKMQATMRPRVVRRGVDESEIEDLEPTNIDHLLLLCHGVGSACDMRLRTVEQVVNDFRATSFQLLQSHYKTAYENGVVGRVEVLPISWHATLHSGATGVDRRLSRITLDSIPKLRNFTNDTVLDVLFYTSPVFSQTILETVCKELNRIYHLFRSRNPDFHGSVSVGGHSLGSVILYDLLCHQEDPKNPDNGPRSSAKSYVSGVSADAARIATNYPVLDFHPAALYALGSPIAIFETIRGVESLGLDFCLPTCKKFFNIFHPYDPIAYRMEPLINPALRDVKAVLIPHHKGRKRMHLELKDTIGRVSSDLKHKLLESIRTTWTNMWKWPTDTNNSTLERVVEEEGEKEPLSESNSEASSQNQPPELEVGPTMIGRLNSGRRIDYVLQEAPFEMINEYLFAMTSHVCYWESEDTMLMILREIYDDLGVEPDCTIAQPSMTVQREKIVKSDPEASQGKTLDGPSTCDGT